MNQPSLEHIDDLPAGISLLNIRGAKDRAGIGKSSIYSDMAIGRFPPAMKINGRNYWRSDHIDAWILERVRAACGST